MPDPADTAALLPARPRVAIVGAGLGGLALAIRLQSGGCDVTLIEARKRVGGLAAGFQQDGFIFDTGPAALADPAGIGELWALCGQSMADDLALLAVNPFCRFNWPDGSVFDYSSDPGAVEREVARIAPNDLAGFRSFVEWCAEAHEEVWLKLGRSAMGNAAALASALPTLVRQQAWRPVHALIARFVKSEKLREALSVHVIARGGNPFSASAIHVLHHRRLELQGLHYPKGGFGALAEALADLLRRIGGTVRSGDPVAHLHPLGDRIGEVECRSGWRERFDLVASNADLIHSYRDLLSESPRGPEFARKLSRKRWSPGAFSVHLGIEGTWPGIPHTTMLFGPRFEGLFADIHNHGVLPRDILIALSHPSLTDPSLAPSGKSCLTAVVPVANRGKLPLDWDHLGPVLEERVLAEIGRRLIPDLDDRIVCKVRVTPRDHARDFNAHLGSAYGLEPILTQSGTLRPHNRDAKLKNFYLVGAGTHPGATVPGVLASARISAALILEDLK